MNGLLRRSNGSMPPTRKIPEPSLWTAGPSHAFITKANWPAEPEACALEDADCLVFLETKLQNYVDEWEEEKILRVLQRTLRKMTLDAREHTLEILKH